MFKKHEVLAVVVVGVLCVLAGIHGRSISTIGDVRIDISEEKFLCDKIECPKNTARCVVTKEKPSRNSTVVMRSNTCYSATNEVLKSQVTNDTVDANNNISLHLEGTANGVISVQNSSGSSGDFNATEFQKEFDQEMSDFKNNLKQEMQNLNDEISQMRDELQNMFNY